MIDERTVSRLLRPFFISRGLAPLGKINVFNHADDVAERTFIIDFAVGPEATKGNRTAKQKNDDLARFEEFGNLLDQVVDELLSVCEFPSEGDFGKGWSKAPNPNPMTGLAIEIENAKSKYFLGSLLAASIAGRWGLLIVPNNPITDSWINTVRRMIHKGNSSPIPSNIIIF